MIGYEQSEQLDVEPAKYFVVVTKREKRACKDCEEQGVARAPVPVRYLHERSPVISDTSTVHVSGQPEVKNPDPSAAIHKHLT